MSCGLSSRQKELYHRLKERISIDDLLKSSLSHSNTSKDSTSTLMNIVMQFRKVHGTKEHSNVTIYSHCRFVIILNYLKEEMFSLPLTCRFLPSLCHAYFIIIVSAHLTSLVKGTVQILSFNY